MKFVISLLIGVIMASICIGGINLFGKLICILEKIDDKLVIFAFILALGLIFGISIFFNCGG